MTHDRCGSLLRRTTLGALACAALALAPVSGVAQDGSGPAGETAPASSVHRTAAPTPSARPAARTASTRRTARPAAARAATAAPAAAPAAAPRIAPAPAPFVVLTVSADYLRDSLVALARAQLGRRYVLGAESPQRGFDCSGFVRYLMAALDVRLPRTAAQQELVGESVPKRLDQLAPGDLVTFGKGKRATHIGVYVGDGRFIHASSLAGRVIESELVRPGSRRTQAWRSVRRLVVTPDSTLLNNLLLNNASLGVRS